MLAKLIRKRSHFYILPGEKRVSWRYDILEGKSNGSTTISRHYDGNLPANEMTQFVTAPTNSTAKVAPESEHNGGTITKPSEPGDESTNKR